MPWEAGSAGEGAVRPGQRGGRRRRHGWMVTIYGHQCICIHTHGLWTPNTATSVYADTHPLFWDTIYCHQYIICITHTLIGHHTAIYIHIYTHTPTLFLHHISPPGAVYDAQCTFSIQYAVYTDIHIHASAFAGHSVTMKGHSLYTASRVQ